MKKTYIFCTKWWLFLTEIPPAVILWLCIVYNESVDTVQKLYPLMAFCSLVMIFIFLYFFRLISISTEEIRTIGLFSSKDSAVVEKDRSIIFRMLKGNRLRIELDGRSQAPGFSWIKGGEYDECDINLYREKAIGGRKSISRFLESLYVQPQDIDALFISDEYVKKYDNFEISSYQEHENKVIKIRFTETV